MCGAASYSSTSKPKTGLLALLAFSLLLLPPSCSSYNQRIESYYVNFCKGDYQQANAALDQNRLLRKNRNRLLFLLEKGRVFHAMAQYSTSNHFFNLADKLIEDQRRTGGDMLLATAVNPMMQKYTGEEFEKMMLHYYKALNYFYLNQTDEAVVEARRISLQSQLLGDNFSSAKNRYTSDAFSLILQGAIYEAAGDINNAFIAYRNAAETYLRRDDQIYYGVKLPEQLQSDLLNTAYQNGFDDELQRFQTIFKRKYVPPKTPPGGWLIFFWENGMAPVKTQYDFFFSLVKRDGQFFFEDRAGLTTVPFHPAVVFTDRQFDAVHLDVFHVSYPVYRPQPVSYTDASLSDGSYRVATQRVQDIDQLAERTLKERFVKELSLTLSRLAVKKAAEYLIRASARNSRKDKKLKEGVADAVQLYTVLSEKADTRNWQTLPAYINYARIPLNKGKNILTLTLSDPAGRKEIHSIEVQGSGRLVFYNYSSLPGTLHYLPSHSWQKSRPPVRLGTRETDRLRK